jgi:N-acetylglutamate synthase-like GNAT family acetyltransferase
VHQSQLPELPRRAENVETHALAFLIKAAEKTHLESQKKMGLRSQISKNDLRAKHQQIIGCMWVYVYKTDKHGRFVKVKARLVVRGD